MHSLYKCLNKSPLYPRLAAAVARQNEVYYCLSSDRIGFCCPGRFLGKVLLFCGLIRAQADAFDHKGKIGLRRRQNIVENLVEDVVETVVNVPAAAATAVEGLVNVNEGECLTVTETMQQTITVNAVETAVALNATATETITVTMTTGTVGTTPDVAPGVGLPSDGRDAELSAEKFEG